MTDTKPATGALRYPQIVAFVRDTPWQILEQKLVEIREFIAVRAHGDNIDEYEISEGPARRDAQMAGSVAIVPIHGVITPRADLMTQMSGGTSIDRLQASIQAAADDPNVSAIVLDVNSPGGSVQGLAEAAQTIRQARAVKPVVAVANHTAASAAYRLASQASEFVASPSAHVGSIGTIAAHDDISKLQEMAGVKTTMVTAGKYKAELSPFAPLSEEARGHLQETVDKHQQMFEQDVARGRGIPVDKVRSDFGQGRMLLAKDARDAGMVDRIATMSDVIRGLQKQAAQPAHNVANAETALAVAARAMGLEPVKGESGDNPALILLPGRSSDETDPPPESTEQTETEAAESGLSFAGRIDSLVAEASILVDDITSLAGFRERQHLSGAKRERLAACTGSLREVADAMQGVLAATDKPTQSDALLRERLRFERARASHGGTQI